MIILYALLPLFVLIGKYAFNVKPSKAESIGIFRLDIFMVSLGRRLISDLLISSIHKTRKLN